MGGRALLTVAAVAGVMLASSSARAQMPPPQPPGQIVQMQPQVQTVAPPAQGSVRMHFRMFRSKGYGRIYVLRSDGSSGLVCRTPCTADVPVGAQMRATVGENDEPHFFAVPADMGQEIDVEIRGPSVGALVGGIVMLGTGGALLLSGAILVALAGDTRNSIIDTESLYRTTGYVCIGIGAGVAIGGLVLLLTRSTEPRVEADPHRQGGDRYYGREETMLSDVAAAKPRDPSTAIPPAPVAPVLNFSF
ncbi:MAG: hypothetical protein KF819_33205 [Labilithrix sp.]|nr:hypothetical protein [Labilithrix sp.]